MALDPSHTQGLILLGGILMREGSFLEASQIYARISGPAASSRDLLYQYATALYHSGSYREAYDRVQHLVTRKEKDADLWRLKADIEQSLRLFDDAARSLQEAYRYAPSDMKIPGILGVVLYESGRYREAIPCLEKALSVEPGNGELWKRKGAALEHLKKYLPAAEAFRQAAGLFPGDVSLEKKQGEMLYYAGRCEPALECLNRYLAGVPDDAEVLGRKGKILSRMGEYDLSADAFARAYELDPENPDLLLRYAKSLVSAGRFEESLIPLDALLFLRPDDPVAWRLKAEAESACGRPDHAAHAVEEALRQFPQDPGLLLSHAKTLYENGAFDEAERTLTRVREVAPELVSASELLAEILWLTGDHAGAVTLFGEVLAADEENAKVWFLKGDSLQNLGRFEEAAQAHERAFSLGGDSSVGLLLSRRMRYLQQKNAGI